MISVKTTSPRQIIVISIIGLFALAVVAWQTHGALSEGNTVPVYQVTPPAGISATNEPTIIQPEKLSEPLVEDADIAALVAAARNDYAVVGSLAPDYDELVRRTGSEAIANRMATALAPAAAALAGAQAGEPAFTMERFTGDDAVVGASAEYVLPSGSSSSVRIDLAYTRTDDAWTLAGVSVGEGVGA